MRQLKFHSDVNFMEIYFPIKHRSPQKENLRKNWTAIFCLLSPPASRSNKPEKNDELQHVEKQVEKYRDVLQIISKKVSPPNSISGQDAVAREKRLKKVHEYLLGQAMEDSAKELPDGNSLFRKILDYCGKWEKSCQLWIMKIIQRS